MLKRGVWLIFIIGLIVSVQGCGDSVGDVLGVDTSGSGCGSGWSTNVVRDQYWDVDFAESCEHHDLCYETCGATKKECDDTFYDELKDTCKDTYSKSIEQALETACLGAARIYYEGVENAGEDAFSDAQESCQM